MIYIYIWLLIGIFCVGIFNGIFKAADLRLQASTGPHSVALENAIDIRWMPSGKVGNQPDTVAAGTAGGAVNVVQIRRKNENHNIRGK